MSAYQYPIHIANIRIQNEDKIRTSVAYIHGLLEEEGLNLHHSRNENEMMTLGRTSEVLSVVCARLRDTGLYDGVSIEIDKLDSQDSNDNVGDNKVQLNITLDEKKWYKLYVGAGVKQQGFGMGMSESSQLGALPKAQFEASANVSNIRGNTDVTAISYTIDQASVPTFVLSHDAPAKISIEDMEHASWRCIVDTTDYELARSYKEYHRSLSYRLSNSRSPSPFLCDAPWRSLEWTAKWRDIQPCRFPNAPFACDASPNIISEAGPSLKHSLSFDYKMNGVNLDNRITPTRGFDMSVGAEIAGPPGDVGFFKASNALSIHFPLINSLGLCFHASFSSGFARNISFGGTCNRTLPISDRYFVGGPLNLRGFQASGIGPRAKENPGAPGGDSLGGEIFYTSLLMASVPFPTTKLKESGARLMGFVNMGTLTGWGVPVESIVRTTRVAAGVGAFCETPLGRMEGTFAVPIRCGSRDKTERFQFGFGLTF